MSSNGDENDFIECDRDTRDKIKLKLMDIHEAFNITNIDCNFFEKNIDHNSIGYPEAKSRLDIYENISKLSVYLMHDYDFFANCTIKSAFKCPIYNTAMEKLGYQRYRSDWTLHSKPSQEIIIDSIFKYCLYSYIVQKKNQDHKKSFAKKPDYYNDEQRRNQRPMKKEQFENQRDQKQRSKQERSFSYEDNNMKYKQKYEDTRNKVNRENDKRDNVYVARKDSNNHNNIDNSRPNIPYVDRPPDTRNKINRENDKRDNVYVARKDNNNQSNIDNSRPNIPYVDRPPNNDISNKWKCKVCEMMNSFQFLYCEACDNIRPNSGKWACLKCTFINELSSINCEVCAAELK